MNVPEEKLKIGITNCFQGVKAHVLGQYFSWISLSEIESTNDQNICGVIYEKTFSLSEIQFSPNVPVEKESRLDDSSLLTNFITRVYTYDRWRALREKNTRSKDLVNFHTAYKMLLLAHSEPIYRQMGPLVAQAGLLEINDLLNQYEEKLMTALKELPTRKQHTNVLYHLFGFLKDELKQDSKQEILNAIEGYRLNRVPLVKPLVLMQHHFRLLKHTWVDAQVYFKIPFLTP